MEKMKIYLAGPLTDWRNGVVEKLGGLYDFYNPVTDSRQRSQLEYAPDDLMAAKNCDIILAYQPKDRDGCLAMAVEATMGFCNGAIVIYVDERGALDPIFVAISKMSFSSLDSAIDFLKKFSVNYEDYGIKNSRGDN